MKILFAGTPRDALVDEVVALGHDARNPPEADWWHADTPEAWGDAICRVAAEWKPDAFVLHKGWRWRENAQLWSVPVRALWHLRRLGLRMVYLCFDDPAATPITLQLELHLPFDYWLTTCPGIRALFPIAGRVRVEEYWLAWDDRVPQPVPVCPELEVDVAITGHPYYKPFPPPHYPHGFGTPRADLARGCIERGWRVGLWGPATWLDREHGGDPLLAPWYRGWLDPSLIHLVHRAARVNLVTQLVEGWRYDSGRIPWVGGAGGCLAHEHRPGLEEEFGGSVGWFRVGDLQAAMDKVDFLLRHPAVRAQMIDELRAHVLARHTWRHRAQRLLELLGV